jgi:5-methylcytosine-specific restriction endonuclease McrA
MADRSRSRIEQTGGRAAWLHRLYKASTCELCGAGGVLHIHHKNWHHFDDRPANLMTVCQSCHSALHRAGYLTDDEFNSIKAAIRSRSQPGGSGVAPENG